MTKQVGLLAIVGATLKSSAITRFWAVALVLAALVSASQAAGTLYMSDRKVIEDEISYYWSNLYTVHATDGSATFVGRVQSGGHDVVLEDIAYDPATAKMYGVDGTQLYTLDFQHPSGGVVAATLVGSITGMIYGGDNMSGLTVSPTGTLYGGTTFGTVDTLSGSLFVIDPTTAAATRVGFLGTHDTHLLYDSALAMNDAGQLYGSLYTMEDSDNSFASINTSTGTASVIGSLPWDMEGMTFADGILYGGGYNLGQFYLIDPTTGATTLLGDNWLHMTGLTDVPSAPTIPVPGAVALAGIGAGLAGWLRRRRTL